MGFVGSLYRQVFIRPGPLPEDLDLSGQTILVTGATSGIGLEVAEQCVRLQAGHVILAVRNTRKGEEVKQKILRSNSTSTKTLVDVWELDLESPESVLAFGRQAQRALDLLDIALLNAAVFLFSWTAAQSTGLESSIQVNQVLNGMLSLLLLPVLKKSPVQLVHMWTTFREPAKGTVLQDLSKQESYDPWNQYFRSKLLNVFWARELAEHTSSQDVIINMVNPGSVNTSLHRDGSKLVQAYDRIVGRTVEEAARMLISAAVVHGVETHGEYLSEDRVTKSSAYVRSDKGALMQTRIWDETLQVLRQLMPSAELDNR
ncbi:3-oxoacyl-reductase [Penicillium hispanicum]|uniref:3-oxoacyl-reductase n=1 Tax=Penicillium hispanicum TaxID=1080232 RepID=UPI00254077BB|nr:3-oxoacyl-reductase [Penicillium hispanicum]KAJ5587006.1 3-oxoacyl-reductase [Penicillium hispanicum]